MGRAIAGGLISSSQMKAEQIIATARTKAGCEKIEAELKVHCTTDNLQACSVASVIILCLKPQRIPDVIGSDEMRKVLAGKLVISIAAGLSLDELQKLLPKSKVVRAMPNTPSLIGHGMTVLSRNSKVSDGEMKVATEIFSAVGDCLEVEDKHMNAVTSLNGSGPGFV